MECLCISCGQAINFDSAGFHIHPVSCFSGPKSGRLMISQDSFPDGKTDKYICFGCTPPELLELLGWEDEGGS